MKTLNRLLLALAIVAALFAWGRLLSAASSNPPPANILTPAVYCEGTLVSTADALWRFPCFDTPPVNDLTTETAFALRIVPGVDGTGAAQQRWPLADANPTSQPYTFLPHPADGSIVIGYTTIQADNPTAPPRVALARLLADGAVAALALPPDAAPSTLLGAAWVGDTFELVYRVESVDPIDVMPLLFGGGGDDDNAGEAPGDDMPDTDDPAPPDANTTNEAQTPDPVGDEAENGQAGQDGDDAGDGEGDGEGGGFMLPPLPVPRATVHIAALMADGDGWQTRDVAEAGCAQFIMVCWPQRAYRDGDQWRIVYTLYSALLDNVTGVDLGVLTGSEDTPPTPTTALPIFDMTRCFTSTTFDSLLFMWQASPLDPSRTNILSDALCLPMYRLETDGGWTLLPVPQSPDGINYNLPTDRAFYFDGESLTLLPVVGTLRSFNPQLYLTDRWLSLEYRPVDTPHNEAALSLVAADGTVYPVIGRTRSDWTAQRVPLAAPDGAGGLWLIDARGDHARVNADLARTDAPGLLARFSRMIGGNFGLYPPEAHPIYSADLQPLRQASVPWLLIGLPLLLIVALAGWRGLSGGVPFVASRALTAALLVYLLSFVGLVGWLLALTAYL